MNHIWRTIARKPKKEVKIVLKEIKNLHEYYQTKFDEQDYPEANKALVMAVQLFYNVIVDHPEHPKKEKMMRDALEMLREQQLLEQKYDCKEKFNIKFIKDEKPMFDGFDLEYEYKAPPTKGGKQKLCDEDEVKINTIPNHLKHLKFPTQEIQQAFLKFGGLVKDLNTMPDNWDNIVGLKKEKDYIYFKLNSLKKYRHVACEFDKSNGVLLYGPPGTGKSMLAQAIAKKVGLPYLQVQGNNLLSKYIGEAEQNIHQVFLVAKYLAPCIVFIGKQFLFLYYYF
jgi:SpoVK/Ycf46/Vps4 family AAA+-type ATPase